jgi:hypothetical protein
MRPTLSKLLLVIGAAVEHSEYYNRVNIETDGKKIIVYGNESHGRYVEHLDINSVKMFVNKNSNP